MADEMLDLGHGFWNLRGSFRIGGVLNVGTHASILRLSNGQFLMLDCYALRGDVRARVMALTDGGQALEAVVNLHPFHTVHCAEIRRDFPQARFYGTARHHQMLPELDWEPETSDSPRLAERYAEDVTLMRPDGIELVTADDRVHAGSVLAWHQASKTLHVDDTLNLLPVPGLLRGVLPPARLFLHPTLPKALSPMPGAMRKFRNWAQRLATECRALRHLVVAHDGHREFAPGEFSTALQTALRRMSPRLERAEARRARPAV